MLLNTTAPGATTPGFAFQVTFRTGTEPISVTAADVNGDGKPDVIVANNSGQTLSVLLNETPPGAAVASFGTPQAFATDGFPYSVTTADVNGDGKPDLIAANLTLTGTTVSVLINTTAPGATTPSFAPQVPFAAGTVNTPPGLATGDINGDGKPDVIVTNGNVLVFLNTTVPGAATPSFAAAQQILDTGSAFPVTIADINRDGKPDLITANSSSPATVSVLLNTTAPGATTASFTTPKTFPIAVSPQSVTTADINGDGKLDLIVASFTSPPTCRSSLTPRRRSLPPRRLTATASLPSRPSPLAAARTR